MKIISWNVNGLKAILSKNFEKDVSQLGADFICIQEIKKDKKTKEMYLNNYFKYYNYSKIKGYSGVAIFAKEEPLNVLIGMEIEDEYGEIYQADDESRVIALEYNDFYLVSVYVPHAKDKNRSNYRQSFDEHFIEYVTKLNDKKDTIICGDFNICHKCIDICNIHKHTFVDDFSDEIKANFNELLNKGFVDTYRYMHPQMREYTFWNNTDNRKEKQTGWRLDYILVSEYLKKEIRQVNILKEIGGSDHCPVELVLKL